MTITTRTTIDWLSYTIDVELGEFLGQGIPDPHAKLAHRVTGLSTTWEVCEPLHGYRVGLRPANTHTPLILTAGATAGMGTHVQWSGAALQQVDPEGTLRFALYAGGRCRRIDLALDANARIDFSRLFQAARAGELDTRARKYSIIESDTGTTVYVGARTSEQYLRVYDKAGEQGVEGDWTRIELECKGRTANAVAAYISAHSLTDVPSVIKSFCNWPSEPLWRKIFVSVPKRGVPLARKQTDTARWLDEQVKPALRDGLQERRPWALEFLIWAAERLDSKHLWEVLEAREAGGDDFPF